jgi:hypothetical protein
MPIDSDIWVTTNVRQFDCGLFERDLMFIELDEDPLATNSKQQRWGTPAVRQECRAAYR